MPHTKVPGAGNKIKFVLLWIVSHQQQSRWCWWIRWILGLA